MNIFDRLWSWFTDLVSHFWQDQGPAIIAWGQQFLTGEGKVVLQDAAVYGPQILSGQITITDAAAKLGQDLLAKGIQDVDALKEIIFNALRTQTNLAAGAAQSALPVEQPVQDPIDPAQPDAAVEPQA